MKTIKKLTTKPKELKEIKPVKSKSKSMGKRNRAAGHGYERQIVNELKEIWPKKFGECCTSRSESKRTDDKGVDICFTPGYQFQTKNCKDVQKYWELLPGMPQAGPLVNVVIHKKTKRAGSKFVSQGEYAIMTKADLYKIFLRLQAAEALILE